MLFQKSILAVFITGFFFLSSYSQEKKEYSEYLNKTEVNDAILKFCDPEFPQQKVILGTDNTEMAEYAKVHPPFPRFNNTGNPEYDKNVYENRKAEWINTNPYYPQFIPYHLFNRLLTPDDDITIYVDAKNYWIKSNPAKYEEMNSIEK